MPEHRCLACYNTFGTAGQLSRHVGNTLSCEQHYDKLSTEQAKATPSQLKRAPSPSFEQPASARPTPVHLPTGIDLPGAFEPLGTYDSSAEPVSSSKRPRVTVEEVVDEDNMWEYQNYPGAGVTLGKSTTYFEEILADQQSKGQHPHAPFADEEEWDLVCWLMRHTTQAGIDDYAKLPIVSRQRIQKEVVYSLLRRTRLAIGAT